MWRDIWRERYVSLAFCLLYWDSYKCPHSFRLLDLIKTLCVPLGCTYNFILLHSLHKQMLYRRINGKSLTIPVQLCPSAGLLLLQKHRHGTHNKHLGPLSRPMSIMSQVIHSPLGSVWGPDQGLSLMGGLWVPRYQSCESPREASVWRAQDANWWSSCTKMTDYDL